MKLAALLVLLPLAAAAATLPENEEGLNWAVLVAGSNGWYNYRHQSDICHAYQIMKNQGIPDERIIVMMYDDIAGHSSNPFPGEIYNHPSAQDVYGGVPKDYVGADVTPELFLAVLQGNTEAVKGRGSGKVVQSGPNDRIFLNLDDHGTVGLFAFPYSELMADELANAVTSMNAAGKFKQMLIYIESCESGSMFQDLYPDSLNAYGLSASSPYESSWATYCSSSILPGTCLGDEFSCNWMEDTEANDPNTETLQTQFENTEALTLGSQVMQWGDLSQTSQTVATFFAPTSNSANKKVYSKPEERSAVSTQDVPLFALEHELKTAKDASEYSRVAQEIAALKERRAFVGTTIKEIALAVTSDDLLASKMLVKNESDKVTNWNCYNPVAHAFSKNCFNLGQSTFALTHVHTLLNLCEAGYTAESIISGMKSVCTFPTIYNAY